MKAIVKVQLTINDQPQDVEILVPVEVDFENPEIIEQIAQKCTMPDDAWWWIHGYEVVGVA